MTSDWMLLEKQSHKVSFPKYSATVDDGKWIRDWLRSCDVHGVCAWMVRTYKVGQREEGEVPLEHIHFSPLSLNLARDIDICTLCLRVTFMRYTAMNTATWLSRSFALR